MPGYNQTLLQGLQHLVPGTMNQRRLSELIYQREFARRLSEARYVQSQQAMRNLQRQRDIANTISAANVRVRGQMRDIMQQRQNLQVGEATSPQGETQELLTPEGKVQQFRFDKFGRKFDAASGTLLPPNLTGQVRQPRPLPNEERTALQREGADLQSKIALLNSFKPDYSPLQYNIPVPFTGGKNVGELWNGLKERLPINSPEAQWWRRAEQLYNVPIASRVGGKTLSKHELDVAGPLQIRPGLDPAQISNQLATDIALTARSLARRMTSLQTRYHPQEIVGASGLPAMPTGSPPAGVDLDSLVSEGNGIVKALTPPPPPQQ